MNDQFNLTTKHFWSTDNFIHGYVKYTKDNSIISIRLQGSYLLHDNTLQIIGVKEDTTIFRHYINGSMSFNINVYHGKLNELKLFRVHSECVPNGLIYEFKEEIFDFATLIDKKIKYEVYE